MRWAPLATLVALLLAAPKALASWGLPEPVTDRLQIVESIYLQLLVLGTIVFLVVFIWGIYNLAKFRPGGDGEPSYEEHRGSIKAELVWTVIPILIVAWVGVISYDGMQAMNEVPEQPAAEIDIKGFQFFWQAEYGKNVRLDQQPGNEGDLEGEDPFLIPANEPVVFNVTGGDVIHSFAIPELGIKADAIPGQSQQVSVSAPEGEYLIQCAEFCGRDHAYMRAKLHAVPMEEYEDWLSEREREGELGERVVEVNLTQEGIEPANLTAVADVPTGFQVNNQAEEVRSLSIEGVEGAESGDIEPGESAIFEATLGAGEYQLTSQGAQATLTVREVETIQVQLDEWAIRSDRNEFQAGEPYLLEIENVGSNVHNLYIGAPEEEAGTDDILWQSANLNPGNSTTLLIEPSAEQAGEYTWWCDIAGHYSQGMLDDVTIIE